jgi:hypothetical protein
MMKYLILVISIFLIGCEQGRADRYAELADTARCTEKQYKQVEGEFSMCQSTSYLSSFCMDRAIVRWCEPTPQQETIKQER